MTHRRSQLFSALLIALASFQAQGAYYAPVNDSNGNPFIIYNVIEPNDDPNDECDRELSAAELNEFLSAGQYWLSILGNNKDSEPVLSISPSYEQFSTAAVTFSVRAFKNEGDQHTQLFDALQGRDSEVAPVAILNMGGTAVGYWDTTQLSVLPSYHWAPSTASNVVHELTHALGLNSVNTFFRQLFNWENESFYDDNPIVDGTLSGEWLNFYNPIEAPEGWRWDNIAWHVGYSGIKFSGAHVREVIGENTKIYFPDAIMWETIPKDENPYVEGGIPILGLERSPLPGLESLFIYDFAHIELQNSLLSHQTWRNWGTLMEAELALVQDLGYEFDRKRFFGTSFYQSDSEELTVTQGYFARKDNQWVTGTPSTQQYGVGVHVYGSNNNVSIQADQLADGDGAIGVRIDGSQNKLTLEKNSLITANGSGGTGILVSYGRQHELTLNGDVEANGSGGVGLRFDFGGNALGVYSGYFGSWTISTGGVIRLCYWENGFREVLKGSLVEKAVISGNLSGEKAAIYIGPTAHVQTIQIMPSAKIEGHIISDWSAIGGGWWDDSKGAIMAYSLMLPNTYAVAPKEEDLTTEILFGDPDTEQTSESMMTYEHNIIGPYSLRLRVAKDTELQFKNVYASVLGMTLDSGATLRGSAVFDLQQDLFSGRVLSGDEATRPNDFSAGVFINRGTLISTPQTGEIMIDGHYQQSGHIVLGVRGSGELISLQVTGVALIESGSTLGVIPVGDYYEGTYELDAKGQITTGVSYFDVQDDILSSATWETELLGKISPTISFSSNGKVLTAQHQANAYSKYVESTGWQKEIAKILDANASDVSTKNTKALYADLDFSAMDGSGIKKVVGNLGGHALDDQVRSQFAVERLLDRAVFSQLNHHEGDRSLWALPFGGQIHDKGALGKAQTTASGAIFGVSLPSENSYSNAYFGAAHLSQRSPNHLGKMTGNGVWVGVSSTSLVSSGLTLQGQFRAGVLDIDSERYVALNQSVEKNTSEGIRFSAAASVRAGWKITELLPAETSVMPFVSLSGTALRLPGETENGVGALKVNSDWYQSLSAGFGVEVMTPRIASQVAGYSWRWSSSIAYNRELLDHPGTLSADLADLRGNFHRDMTWQGRNRLNANVMLELFSDSNFTVKAQLDAEMVNGDFAAAAAMGELNWRF